MKCKTYIWYKLRAPEMILPPSPCCLHQRAWHSTLCPQPPEPLLLIDAFSRGSLSLLPLRAVGRVTGLRTTAFAVYYY